MSVLSFVISDLPSWKATYTRVLSGFLECSKMTSLIAAINGSCRSTATFRWKFTSIKYCKRYASSASTEFPLYHTDDLLILMVDKAPVIN